MGYKVGIIIVGLSVHFTSIFVIEGREFPSKSKQINFDFEIFNKSPHKTFTQSFLINSGLVLD